MTRILALPQSVRSHPLITIFRQIREARRQARDAARLDTLPRDRLDDMGIAPRSEANRRHSGARGPIHQMPLW
ncbi:hypothetical protein FIU97_13605 [Roseivivax sp. THAF40]|uniref:hypothetical protein n=1 Tax=unclassified Roseivivax TaxID=2639302 RepID=UPI00126825C4|nr:MULTISPECIES: hypothetical protein [unclassified Roseivivax]QFS83778.1 hypothetical protein FIV09_13165 [Roseivivax sp. THAF197b]QFT47610.1 hypothetical protein FIU97_13605 [Roseivivax sp. THAF40]